MKKICSYNPCYYSKTEKSFKKVYLTCGSLLLMPHICNVKQQQTKKLLT